MARPAMFHLTGVGAKLHGTGSGDTILNWIALGVMAALALAATLIWSLLSEFRSNPHSPTRGCRSGSDSSFA